MTDSAYKITFLDKKAKKNEYLFDKLKEALIFSMDMKKKGIETNLTRVKL